MVRMRSPVRIRAAAPARNIRFGLFLKRMTSGCCAVGSAPALGAGGREFESRHSDHVGTNCASLRRRAQPLGWARRHPFRSVCSSFAKLKLVGFNFAFCGCWNSNSGPSGGDFVLSAVGGRRGVFFGSAMWRGFANPSPEGVGFAFGEGVGRHAVNLGLC